MQGGITSQLVDTICRLVCKGPYMGTYNIDSRPPGLLDLEYANFILYLPPTTESQSVGHFVTCIVKPDTILCIDSAGLHTTSHRFGSLLNEINAHPKKRRLFINKKKIQSTQSTHCALYAILFCLYYDDPTRDFSMSFIHNGGETNDKQCVSYLHQLIDSNKTNVCTLL